MTTTETDNTRTTFDALVERLSRQSVDKHFDAYVDVSWDDPDMVIDRADPRFELVSFDPLSSLEWYQNQTPEIRAEVGLYRICTLMRTGWEFENVLQRGLLLYAFNRPNNVSDFRYVHHEVIEESQHSLMFQEFVNRAGLDAEGIPRPIKRIANLIAPLARLWPSLFFLFVLGGEDPVDHLQRRLIKSNEIHPLFRQIMHIHVTEEARHLSFARHYLKTNVPRLGLVRRHMLAAAAPILLGIMARLMIDPNPSIARRYGIPKAQVRAITRSPANRALLSDSVAKVRRLCEEIGVVTPASRLLWNAMGIGARATSSDN